MNKIFPLSRIYLKIPPGGKNMNNKIILNVIDEENNMGQEFINRMLLRIFMQELNIPLQIQGNVIVSVDD